MLNDYIKIQNLPLGKINMFFAFIFPSEIQKKIETQKICFLPRWK